MPEQLMSSSKLEAESHILHGEVLRTLTRSPHPYHKQRSELPHPSFKLNASLPTPLSPLRSAQITDDEGGHRTLLSNLEVASGRSTDSDSGTEADDEHILKGLPAPRPRLHKGLRGGEGTFSRTPSPLHTPSNLDEYSRRRGYFRRVASSSKIAEEEDVREVAEKFRYKAYAELARRSLEVLLLFTAGQIAVYRDHGYVFNIWKPEILWEEAIIGCLAAIFFLRLALHSGLSSWFQKWPQLSLPTNFDPAPYLYPPVLTTRVALLLSAPNPANYLPNIILSISSIPANLFPTICKGEDYYLIHWMVSCIPLYSWDMRRRNFEANSEIQTLDREVLILLFPLHEALCMTLHYLTTTSLLPAELQLLSIALINVLLLSSSPQATILKSLLWIGGLGMFLLCGRVLLWIVALARVPRWRFRKSQFNGKHKRSRSAGFTKLGEIFQSGNAVESSESDEEKTFPVHVKGTGRASTLKIDTTSANGHVPSVDESGTVSAIEQSPRGKVSFENGWTLPELGSIQTKQRRHTLSDITHPIPQYPRTTPSGRRKRSNSSVQQFLSLTEQQAFIRTWLYSIYVYICVCIIIFIVIRTFVGKFALNDHEPVGWALGYMFGNIPWFRMQVMTNNLERWIPLPQRVLEEEKASCRSGWVEHLRHATFGPANTRLIISGYWLGIIIVGLATVFRLSAIYEVDTRRKVFHFMMVAMLLPATYVDPTFAALALSLILAIFLLLDLFRASQLPPLSKPLAYFLTPYVDGRDLRGPVVISHIFLLIGCAIPLWLSLGAVPRTGSGPFAGWEVPTRDVSMVSGVICVGMGDAAASLIGRRFGRHKWFWPGGKSIEGSVAFGTAVSVALLAAKAWLKIGGWPDGSPGAYDPWLITGAKVGAAAGVASLTEAVLTGGNDNVIVPVVLWLCVKGLGI